MPARRSQGASVTSASTPWVVAGDRDDISRGAKRGFRSRAGSGKPWRRVWAAGGTGSPAAVGAYWRSSCTLQAHGFERLPRSGVVARTSAGSDRYRRLSQDEEGLTP
jgi:hypothetical protein